MYNTLCYRILFPVIILLSLKAHCQEYDTLCIEPFRKTISPIFVPAGDTLGIKIIHAEGKVHRTVYYSKAAVRSFLADRIIVTSDRAEYFIYDSITTLRIDSSANYPVRTDTINISNFSEIVKDVPSLHRSDKLYGTFIVLGLTGVVSYFGAPLFAKTTSSGTLNLPVYYSMVGYGIVTITAGLITIAKSASYKLPASFHIYTRPPAKPKKYDAVVKIH